MRVGLRVVLHGERDAAIGIAFAQHRVDRAAQYPGVARLDLAFGVVGYLMRKLDYPMAPAVLAIVLGPLAEPALRQSLIGSHGDIMIFFERPISGTIMTVAIVLLLLPLLKLLRRRGPRPGEDRPA